MPSDLYSVNTYVDNSTLDTPQVGIMLGFDLGVLIKLVDVHA